MQKGLVETTVFVVGSIFDEFEKILERSRLAMHISAQLMLRNNGLATTKAKDCYYVRFDRSLTSLES